VTYTAVDGVPSLIGSSSALNMSEVATQDYVADYYDGVRYNRSWSIRYHEDTMEQLVELAPPRGVILDDGCGPGAFLEFVRRRRAADVERTVGVDVSRGMLGYARKRLRDDGAPQLLVQADACRLPFADETFDIVYARALLHHLPNPEEGVREIRRVLKPGGVAVVLDPNKNIVSTLPRYLARRTEHFDDDHKNFKAAELQRIVGTSLRVDTTRFFGYVAYPLLGFPDLISFGEKLPIDKVAGGLIRLDRWLAAVPGVRRFGWGVMLAAHKN
jgi:ubiquinone/menaquinone biosynthesis C-methylase UbiE